MLLLPLNIQSNNCCLLPFALTQRKMLCTRIEHAHDNPANKHALGAQRPFCYYLRPCTIYGCKMLRGCRQTERERESQSTAAMPLKCPPIPYFFCSSCPSAARLDVDSSGGHVQSVVIPWTITIGECRERSAAPSAGSFGQYRW